MTRSEERMHVGTATEETGRVRLRKYIVTETVQQSVPVSHEEVRVEREPITEANIGQAMAGPEISQEEHEVTLHAERPGSPCTPGTEACPLAGAGLLRLRLTWSGTSRTWFYVTRFRPPGVAAHMRNVPGRKEMSWTASGSPSCAGTGCCGPASSPPARWPSCAPRTRYRKKLIEQRTSEGPAAR